MSHWLLFCQSMSTILNEIKSCFSMVISAKRLSVEFFSIQMISNGTCDREACFFYELSSTVYFSKCSEDTLHNTKCSRQSQKEPPTVLAGPQWLYALPSSDDITIVPRHWCHILFPSKLFISQGDLCWGPCLPAFPFHQRHAVKFNTDPCMLYSFNHQWPTHCIFWTMQDIECVTNTYNWYSRASLTTKGHSIKWSEYIFSNFMQYGWIFKDRVHSNLFVL